MLFPTRPYIAPWAVGVFVIFASCFVGCDVFKVEQSSTFSLAWKAPLPFAVLQPASPSIQGGSAFVAVGDEIQRRDLASGDLIWHSSLDDVDFLSGHVFTDQSTVYVYEFSTWIRAFDIESGDLRWSADFGEHEASVFSAPVLVGASIFVPARDAILRVSAENGEISVLTALPDVDENGFSQLGRYASVGPDNTLCVAVRYPSDDAAPDDFGRRGVIYNIDYTSGEIRWSYLVPSVFKSDIEFHQLAMDCEAVQDVLVAVASTRMTGLDRETGEVLWDRVFDVGELGDHENRDGFSSGPAATDGQSVFKGSVREKLYAVDARTGEIRWTGQSDGSFGDDLPVVHDDKVFITNVLLWVYDKSDGARVARLEPGESDDYLFSWAAAEDDFVLVVGFRNVYVFRSEQ